MNKIFLILVLIASSYGQAYILLGAGALDCSEYLDSAEKGRYATDMGLFGGYAQGVFTTMNMLSEIGGLPYKEGIQFTPNTSTLRRVLMKHCNENLTMKYHQAVGIVWVENAK